MQRGVNVYVMTLKWIQSHNADEIAAKMPPDYYAGNKSLYVTALQNQKAIFSPDGTMPTDGPPTVLSIEQLSAPWRLGRTSIWPRPSPTPSPARRSRQMH